MKGYDYAQAGLYFITICVQNRKCLFGNVVGKNTVGADPRVCPEMIADPRVCPEMIADPRVCPKMIVNDAGTMVQKWYMELENKFPDIRCHEMVVMPNHFHCIIENVGNPTRPNLSAGPNENEQPVLGEHVGSPLRRVVQWFKTMTTNEYIRGVKTLGWPPFNGKLWQRNYYEHIIRDEKAYYAISAYIINNPAKWADDTFWEQ